MPPRKRIAAEALISEPAAKKSKTTSAAPARSKRTTKTAATKTAAATKKTAAPKKMSATTNTTANSKKTTTTAAKKTATAVAPKKTTAAKKSTTPAPAKTSKKRAVDDDEEEKAAPLPKRAKKTAAASAPPVKKAKKPTATEAAKKKLHKIYKNLPAINEQLTERLDIYVFGGGEAGELGLGNKVAKIGTKVQKPTNVMRPRLNPLLGAKDVGVVQIAAGGMHCVALTHDNKILTWGVNDTGALGRDTNWDGGLKDMDEVNRESDNSSAASDEDNEDFKDMNPHECTPGEVDFSGSELAPGTTWVQVAAGDSISLALTSTGLVYGWGLFRGNEGPMGFNPDTDQASRPEIIPELKDITSIKSGANHALALDAQGNVWAWGSNQQCQLGRKSVLGRGEQSKTRDKESLIPRRVPLPKGKTDSIASIDTGSYHSFAISKNGKVYSWGLNSFGATGHMENAGDDEATIVTPQIIDAFRDEDIVSIQGGSHHSIAATAKGECYAFGKTDNGQIGLTKKQLEELPEDQVVRSENGKIGLVGPTKVPDIDGRVVKVATDSEHNVIVTAEGEAWSWGFSPYYQTGQGDVDDTEVATQIEGAAIRDKKLTGATSGGQFSVLYSVAK